MQLRDIEIEIDNLMHDTQVLERSQCVMEKDCAMRKDEIMNMIAKYTIERINEVRNSGLQ